MLLLDTIRYDTIRYDCFIVHSNKCIGDDSKAAARRSPNCIEKTKRGYQSHCQNSGKSCFPTQNFTEIGQSAAELRPKTILNMTAVRHLEFLKIHIWSRDLQIPFLLMFFINPPSVLLYIDN